MGRTKGALNKQISLPDACELAAVDRLQMIASLLVELISEELCTTEQ